MARAKFVKKAAKDYLEHGIKKGESYWWWKFRFGAKHFSKTAPKESQLTQSDFLQQIYSIQEHIDALFADDSLEGELEAIISDLESLKSDCEDKLSNMPDQLQDGSILNSRVDDLDSMIGDLEAIDADVDADDIRSTVEDENPKEDGESDSAYEHRIDELAGDALDTRYQDILEEIQAVTYSGE
jgi:hypothetical protein